MPRKCFKCFLIAFLVAFLFILLLLIRIGQSNEFDDGFYFGDTDDTNEKIPERKSDADQREKILKQKVTEPIILWWTPFTGDKGNYKNCGNVKCFFTVNRHYKDHEQIHAFLFYGTDFKANDLPVPREPHHDWGLLHEESPKNNYLFSNAEVMELFNYTSTFRRESSYPIATQYAHSIEWLEDKKYFVPTKEKNKLLHELSPIIYTQSDCETPSGRDEYTKLLMKYINVDSYGSCLHNKDLPENLRDPIEGMEHDEFYKLNAKYKFSLAMENALCPDYMTEKLWRPFHLGSVPIILGSPKVKDFLPSNRSAIVVDDYNSVEDLANYIKFLNENDEEYEKYLDWKRIGVTNQYLKKLLKEREWHVQNDWGKQEINFIEGFQCYVCKKIHENIRRKKNLEPLIHFQANEDHYGCPGPITFDANGQRQHGGGTWDYEFNKSRYIGKALGRLVSDGKSFTKYDVYELAKKLKDELR